MMHISTSGPLWRKLAERENNLREHRREANERLADRLRISRHRRREAALGREPIAKRIKRETAEKYGVRISDLARITRTERDVAARHEVMFRLANEADYSIEMIGAELGKDLKTVRNGILRHARVSSCQ